MNTTFSLRETATILTIILMSAALSFKGIEIVYHLFAN
jgi:hypothetical protein